MPTEAPKPTEAPTILKSASQLPDFNTPGRYVTSRDTPGGALTIRDTHNNLEFIRPTASNSANAIVVRNGGQDMAKPPIHTIIATSRPVRPDQNSTTRNVNLMTGNVNVSLNHNIQETRSIIKEERLIVEPLQPGHISAATQGLSTTINNVIIALDKGGQELSKTVLAAMKLRADTPHHKKETISVETKHGLFGRRSSVTTTVIDENGRVPRVAHVTFPSSNLPTATMERTVQNIKGSGGSITRSNSSDGVNSVTMNGGTGDNSQVTVISETIELGWSGGGEGGINLGSITFSD